MKAFRSLFLISVTLLSLFVSITGLTAQIDLAARFLQILFFPVTAYLLYILAEHLLAKTPVFDQKTGLRRVLIYYCFIVTATVVGVSFFASRNFPQVASSLIFSPMAIYFLILVWPHRKGALPLKKSEFKLLPATEPKVDVNRRDFLKLIGSAGILALILGLFGRRGGLPNLLGNANLESVTLKDPSGKVINPAQDSPTDGYSISQIDDSSPSYFGFINKNGAWFIMREDEDSSFRYAKGESDLPVYWSTRTKLNYDYFNKVF
ncbi:MAG: hypothetical protein UX88_C0006G0001 [Candidatus Woesebacteria bacterium GW2011_GWC2_47_16]|uniref:Uncharacterized protein n=8 Tax=Candidatus Woeseibacteriota TaxID=1752722 RepID=A0A0G1TQP1_9BACT|nr:MAG: hypothetical protein UX03_C0022G0004 [Candidatus Woesebacteria bacterium GW2011_GWE1_45_18]KKU24365.1 MAG: hypothetical protein UX34_C0007G0018 [Candidatus Woesebacteria bacterium GW2011_GWF1_46_13]KKU47690.1 MAG: hypothetical protein UX67_C0031G0006 [Candidatus Woesebacteria bacterium GW2011_GWF2_46_8]KKU65072.1 MAG: hypothetical protein UX88_C0006G0001 [Candidatus Woesebacteria bacterium GW2011_GWC2_47_16]OGM79511.1 MAG: hypothetical protein A2197_02345 [Candidatus Woesebacteria bacte